MLSCIWLSVFLFQLKAAYTWNYGLNGLDWRNRGQCGRPGPQSPINLPAAAHAAEEEQTMFLKYPQLDASVTVYHNGKSLAFTLPNDFRAGFGLAKGSAGIDAFESEDGEAYRLWQVNFHSPSEHTINGVRLPLEVQFMHQQVTGGNGLAAVAVLFQAVPNEYGAFLDSILRGGLPSSPWEETTGHPPLDLAPLLRGSTYYRYEGSLTVPPCEQNVKYFVRKEPVPADLSQLTQFSKVLQETCQPKGNYRAVQHQYGDVKLVASVDVIADPQKITKPVKSKFAEVGQDQQVESCTADEWESFWHQKDRITTADSEAISKAKTAYNFANNEYQKIQNDLNAMKRWLKATQAMYDSSPGLVLSIELKMQLYTKENLLKQTMQQLPAKERQKNAAEETLTTAIQEECKRRRGKNPRQTVLEAQETPEPLTYPEPHVSLPHGHAASPFSSDDSEPHEGEVPPRIAVNLRQPDIPAGSTIEEATGTALRTAPRPEYKDTVFTIRLPTPLATANDTAFSVDLVKALAASSDIAANRLEVEDVRSTAVPQVNVGGQLPVSAAIPRALGPTPNPATAHLFWDDHGNLKGKAVLSQFQTHKFLQRN